MAWNALVIGQGRQAPGRILSGIAKIDPVDAGARSIQGWLVVIATGSTGLDEGTLVSVDASGTEWCLDSSGQSEGGWTGAACQTRPGGGGNSQLFLLSNGTTGGTVVLNGFAKVTLTTNNTYTGSTIINAGTLEISGTGSIASSSSITTNGSLVFDLSGSPNVYVNPITDRKSVV